MKRVVWMLTVFVLLASLLSGCGAKSPEESAVTDVVVEGADEDPGTEEDLPEKIEQEESSGGGTAEQPPVTEEKNPEEKNPEEKDPEEKEPSQQTPEEETPQEQEPSGEQQEEQQEETQVDYSDYIKVASYNIKCFFHGEQKDAIIEELRQIDADLVGLQEVDVDTIRSGQGNQVQILAEELDYPYWYFAKSIDFQGGQYGHGVLSRYPIKSSEIVEYKVIANGDHLRNYERHVLDVDGKELVFYNTHLTLGSDSENGAELKQVTSAMCQDQYAVLTGDLNMEPTNMGRYIDTKKLTVLNGGDDFLFMVNTAPQGSAPTKAIDNIVVTDTLDYYWDDSTNVGLQVHYSENSDHNLVYTYINFK